MSFNEVLAELPAMTLVQRQLLIRRAVELDEPILSDGQAMLVEERLAAHHEDPSSAISLNAMKEKLRAQAKK